MKDIFIRAGKTFVQAAFGVVVVSAAAGIDITNKTAMIGLAVSAVSAGASAAMNIIINAVNGGNENA